MRKTEVGMAQVGEIEPPERKWNYKDVRRALETTGTVLFIVVVQILICLIAVVLLVLGPAIVLVLGLVALVTTLWETYENKWKRTGVAKS